MLLVIAKAQLCSFQYRTFKVPSFLHHKNCTSEKMVKGTVLLEMSVR
jgi:hypothetical protein